MDEYLQVRHGQPFVIPNGWEPRHLRTEVCLTGEVLHILTCRRPLNGKELEGKRNELAPRVSEVRAAMQVLKENRSQRALLNECPHLPPELWDIVQGYATRPYATQVKKPLSGAAKRKQQKARRAAKPQQLNSVD